MTIENQVKEMIIKKYGTLSEAAKKMGIPYSTLASILSRGIQTASVKNMIVICKSLNISADALGEGKIIDNTNNNAVTDINEILEATKLRLMSYSGLMFNGKPADAESVQSILDAMEIGMEMARRKNDKK